MAHSTLAVVYPSDFPQVFASAINHQIALVDALLKPSQFPCCDFEYPESTPGAGNGYPCISKSTVHHLASGLDYCAKHYPEVMHA